MKTHIEEKPRSAARKEDGFAWRYAAICGETFIGGGPEHRIAEPGKAPTCPACNAKIAALVAAGIAELAARDELPLLDKAQTERLGGER